MRPIDADRLKTVLENLKAHAEEHGIFPAFSVLVDYVIEVIGNQPAIAPLPNNPLPLEELREMDGEPVWIVPMRGSGGFCTWMLVDAEYELCREAHGEMAIFENCGKTWLAYRRRPEAAP